MDNALRQLMTLLILSVILGLGVNLVSPNRIDFIGNWRDVSTGNKPIVPPEHESGDPPFISLNVAQMLHSQKGTLFIDARDVEEFECGTIPGSISVPFDYLPEEDLAGYFDSVLSTGPPFHEIVTFCSGEECDLSLHLARNLDAFGHSNLSIFFGGSREWEKAGLSIERRMECAE
jgi:3-mercaptopyruvate sulfurtransferase SseA